MCRKSNPLLAEGTDFQQFIKTKRKPKYTKVKICQWDLRISSLQNCQLSETDVSLKNLKYFYCLNESWFPQWWSKSDSIPCHPLHQMWEAAISLPVNLDEDCIAMSNDWHQSVLVRELIFHRRKGQESLKLMSEETVQSYSLTHKKPSQVHIELSRL